MVFKCFAFLSGYAPSKYGVSFGFRKSCEDILEELNDVCTYLNLISLCLLLRPLYRVANWPGVGE